jgi:hypothetical protein
MLKLSDTIERKFVDSIDLDDEWEIESDSGWVDITQIHKTIEYQEWYIETADGSSLVCADTHIVFDENLNEVFVKDLVDDQSFIMSKTGPQLITKVIQTENYSNMFDLTVNSDNHRLYTGNVLSHNTTTSIAYLLWTVLFHDSQNIAILANRGQTARDILAKLQLAYENLPIWLQQGVTDWNKSYIELENGSKITASSTSSSAARSGSYNCVDGATMIQCQTEEGTYINDSIENLYNMQENIITKQKTNGMKVLSEGNVFRNFDFIARSESDKIINLYFDDGSNLTVTEDHKILCNDEWTCAIDIQIGDFVYGTEYKKEVIYKKKSNKKIYVYDVINVENTNNFFANQTLIKNCVFLDEFAFVPSNIATEFFTSVYPVITSGTKTKIIIVSTPNGMNLFYKIWMDAINKRNNYVPFEVHWSQVPGRDDAWREETIKNTSEHQFQQEFESLDFTTLINNGTIDVSIGDLYEQLKNEQQDTD